MTRPSAQRFAGPLGHDHAELDLTLFHGPQRRPLIDTPAIVDASQRDLVHRPEALLQALRHPAGVLIHETGVYYSEFIYDREYPCAWESNGGAKP